MAKNLNALFTNIINHYRNGNAVDKNLLADICETYSTAKEVKDLYKWDTARPGVDHTTPMGGSFKHWIETIRTGNWPAISPEPTGGYCMHYSNYLSYYIRVKEWNIEAVPLIGYEEGTFYMMDKAMGQAINWLMTCPGAFYDEYIGDTDSESEDDDNSFFDEYGDFDYEITELPEEGIVANGREYVAENINPVTSGALGHLINIIEKYNLNIDDIIIPLETELCVLDENVRFMNANLFMNDIVCDADPASGVMFDDEWFTKARKAFEIFMETCKYHSDAE